MVDVQTFLIAGSLLFVFWAYGVVSFVLDVKNKLVPALRRYRAGEDGGEEGDGAESDRDPETVASEEEAREKLRQLY